MGKVYEVEVTDNINVSVDVNADLVQKIEINNKIPRDVKDAIKDFLSDTFNESWRTLQELMEITPLPEFSEYWDIVLTIIKSL